MPDKKLVYSGISKSDECPICAQIAPQYLFTDGTWKCNACSTVYSPMTQVKPVTVPAPWFASLSPLEFKLAYETMGKAFVAASKHTSHLAARHVDYDDYAAMTVEFFETWQDMFAV